MNAGLALFNGFACIRNTDLTTQPRSWSLIAGLVYRAAVLLVGAHGSACYLLADAIPVKEKQGDVYGFVVLKSAEGKVIAVGDEITTVEDDRIRSRLTLHFRDGSIDDELSVFTQGRVFRLLSDHHTQRGPSFPNPLDMSIDMPSKTVSWRETKNGKQESHTEKMDLPSDLANGMTSLIVENFPKASAELTVSYLAGTSKPRLVKLLTRPDGEEAFRIAGMTRPSKKYRIHVEIPGLMGVLAPLVGKQPADVEMWVTAGEVATFLRMRGPFYNNGPIWTTEIAAPAW